MHLLFYFYFYFYFYFLMKIEIKIKRIYNSSKYCYVWLRKVGEEEDAKTLLAKGNKTFFNHCMFRVF